MLGEDRMLGTRLFRGNSSIDNEIWIYTNKTLIFVKTRDDKISKTLIRSKKY